jgi:hypothetical protein
MRSDARSMARLVPACRRISGFSILRRAFHGALRPITNFLNRINLFLPVQSLSEKYSPSHFPQISPITVAVPFLTRGVGHRHERWDGMRWTRQRRARNCGRRAVFRERPRRADERCCFCLHQCFDGRAHAAEAAWRRRGRGRQKRVVLAPVAGAKSAEVLRAQPGPRKTAHSPMTVTRRIRRRGERAISR